MAWNLVSPGLRAKGASSNRQQPPISRPKYPGELEGQRPSSAEEEAKPDDETKAVRASAQFSNRQPRCIAGCVAAS